MARIDHHERARVALVVRWRFRSRHAARHAPRGIESGLRHEGFGTRHAQLHHQPRHTGLPHEIRALDEHGPREIDHDARLPGHEEPGAQGTDRRKRPPGHPLRAGRHEAAVEVDHQPVRASENLVAEGRFLGKIDDDREEVRALPLDRMDRTDHGRGTLRALRLSDRHREQRQNEQEKARQEGGAEIKPGG